MRFVSVVPQGDKQGAEEDMKQVLELSPEMQQEVSGDYSN